MKLKIYIYLKKHIFKKIMLIFLDKMSAKQTRNICSILFLTLLNVYKVVENCVFIIKYCIEIENYI